MNVSETSSPYECDIIPSVMSDKSERKKSSLGEKKSEFENIVRAYNIESYHNNFVTYLFCDKTFKSTFSLGPVSNSTRHSLVLSEQIENKKLLNNMSIKKNKNDKFIFPNKDNEVDYC